MWRVSGRHIRSSIILLNKIFEGLLALRIIGAEAESKLRRSPAQFQNRVERTACAHGGAQPLCRRRIGAIHPEGHSPIHNSRRRAGYVRLSKLFPPPASL